MSGKRIIHAPRGSERTCKGWHQEAAMRMLMNNLDPEVAENPDQLVVYAGRGRAARSWEAFDAIVRSLRALGDDETLLVQSGKPVGVFRTHEWSPRVLIANSNLVGDWDNWDEFRRLEAAKLVPVVPVTDQVRVGDQNARRPLVGAEHPDRFARLDQQGLIVAQRAQRPHD